MTFDELSADQIRSLLDEQTAAYEALKASGLKLDLTRGKPAAEQLDLSNALLTMPGDTHRAADGTDVRNYGGLTGLPELRSIFAELLHVPVDQLVAEGNASLEIMHDTLVFALLNGTPDSSRPWSQEDEITFICPVPGYDRHFALTQKYGIRMVSVDMRDDGPDVAAVRELVQDPSVKGMWVVPTYSNPSGAVVSEAVAAELAAMDTAAPDFRLYWDNAYAVHHLTEERTKSADILGLCAASGHANRPFVFASTSKITFAGAGVAFFASSPANIEWYLGHIGKRTIGPDKVNQLRHALLLQSPDGVIDLMDRHRAILAPKFEAVLEILQRRLGGYDVATWSVPKGGYFINLDVVEGTAARVVQLAKEAGIALTPAGSSFPYGKDPLDRNIRLAPSFPTIDELRTAMEGVATCVLLAAAEKQAV
ncbi:MAG TPA: aminotransferase class I/II-fold pyridoxal phosphate-dependent enzyme [Aeromicrobium sp.]|nr:aminotransferase class I/II-fold pyridoxal phosphate-dependent enzyme [Aeromicrobium sp.]HKY57830.1 aminotransferase class I/II-fold pyridoxal phosphate-dependent enzyme [Aeromicrobium sp.]